MAYLHGTSYLTEYMRPTVLVVCPRCSAQANAYAGNLTCSKCGLARSSANVPWPGKVRIASLRHNYQFACGTCGSLQPPPPVRAAPPVVPREIDLTCAGCKALTTHPCEVHAIWHADDATDVWFNLPLYLAGTVHGHQLWALNAGHLAIIKRFIAAKDRAAVLREGHGTMLQRLPDWMIGEKIRDDVLRAVRQLEVRLAVDNH